MFSILACEEISAVREKSPASAKENCLKSLEQYRACVKQVHLTFEDRQAVLLSAADSKSTLKLKENGQE